MPNHNLDKYFLASIVETSHDSIITIDLDLEITSWNKGAEELYGYEAAEAIGKRLTALTLPKDFQKLLEKIENIKRNKTLEVFESERVGKNKAHMILEVVVSPVNDESGQLIGVSTIARDLTARRIAEKALHDKDVLHRLVVAQEDERGRISRDLHDDVGQLLIALRFALERAKGVCKDESMAECLTTFGGLVDSIDNSVDFLAWELRPALLDGVGLVGAIDNYLKQWSHHSGIATEFRSFRLARARLAQKVETNLYRIVQEALNNTHKHAKASQVDLSLERRDGLIVLIISDDGAGFSMRSKERRLQGLGLTGMKERTSLIDGTLEIESARGKGTTIRVTVSEPVKNKRQAIAAKSDTDWG
jgi:PAS domain S-box-containing protein